MKYKFWLSLPLVGCKREYEVDMSDEWDEDEWNELTEKERDNSLNERFMDELNNNLEWGWEPVESKEATDEH